MIWFWSFRFKGAVSAFLSILAFALSMRIPSLVLDAWSLNRHHDFWILLEILFIREEELVAPLRFDTIRRSGALGKAFNYFH